MYNIIINNEIVSTVVLPCYVFWHNDIKAFCTCDYDTAEAVLVNIERQSEEEEQVSYYADLVEKEIRHTGFPIATIIKTEG